jgi:hypothetical protein
MPRPVARPNSTLIAATALVLGISPAPLVSRSARAQVVPVGAEFMINTFTRDPQLLPRIGKAANGDFVVVWGSGAFSGGVQQDGSHEGVFGQRYASAGTPLGTEFQINSYTAEHQRRPAVGADPAGGFVVAWESANFYATDQDGSGPGLFAQRYASSGTPLGSEFQVNSFTMGYQQNAAIGVQPSGDFLVAWQSARDGAAVGVFAQRFDSAGGRIGAEFQINTYTPGAQGYPAVAVDGGGGFIVAWQSDGQDGSTDGVFGRRYSSLALPLGGEFQINSYTPTRQGAPRIAMHDSGDFVVVWHSLFGQDGSGIGVFGQRFASDGARIGAEFQVNAYTAGEQSFGSAAWSGDHLLASWHSDGQDGLGFGVFARLYDSSGTPVGHEFQVNAFTIIGQRDPAVSGTGEGAFVIVWESNLLDGSNYGLFARCYAVVTSTPTPTATTLPTDTASPSAPPTSSPTDTPAPTASATATDTPLPTATGSASATPTATPTGMASCPPAPSDTCVTPQAGKLTMKDRDTNDALTWRFTRGPALGQANFGNPTTTDGYALCVYDDGQLKLEAGIPAGPPWRVVGSRGYKYKDTTGANHGIGRVKLLGGAAGRSRLVLRARGSQLPMPTPVSPSAFFTAAVAIRVQLHHAAQCYDTTFTAPAAIVRNDGERVHARF